jgi:hypothetical protein
LRVERVVDGHAAVGWLAEGHLREIDGAPIT